MITDKSETEWVRAR